MLRLANEHEAAAFFLVERTMRRTRPRVGVLGLKAFEIPAGRIERNPLGRLRFRFDGNGHDYEPETRIPSRPLSESEVTQWSGLQRMMSSAKPVADPEWNLVSMRLGPRILRRLPMGGVVTYVPDGTPPFNASFKLGVSVPGAGLEVSLEVEFELLRAIDAFVSEEEHPRDLDSQAMTPWVPPPNAGRQASHVLSTSLGHGRRHGRGKWHRCPLCHTPVVKGLYNPRIPYGALRPGAGAIRDLRGGYLSRLRETYLVADPNSLITASNSMPRTAGKPRGFPEQSRIIE